MGKVKFASLPEKHNSQHFKEVVTKATQMSNKRKADKPKPTDTILKSPSMFDYVVRLAIFNKVEMTCPVGLLRTFLIS
jgi:hypothetical protein